MLTSLFVFAFQSIPLTRLGQFMLLGATTGSLIGTYYTNYWAFPNIKRACWLYFLVCVSLGVAHLTKIPRYFSRSILASLFFAGCVGAVMAVKIPYDKQVSSSIWIAIGCVVSMIGVIRVPGETRSFWRGNFFTDFMFFLTLLVYDLQMLKYTAQSRKDLDPIQESIDLYIDAIGMCSSALFLYFVL